MPCCLMERKNKLFQLKESLHAAAAVSVIPYRSAEEPHSRLVGETCKWIQEGLPVCLPAKARWNFEKAH
jgi:hypothetical protein